jgi:hypothetical protein
MYLDGWKQTNVGTEVGAPIVVWGTLSVDDIVASDTSGTTRGSELIAVGQSVDGPATALVLKRRMEVSLLKLEGMSGFVDQKERLKTKRLGTRRLVSRVYMRTISCTYRPQDISRRTTHDATDRVWSDQAPRARARLEGCD